MKFKEIRPYLVGGHRAIFYGREYLMLGDVVYRHKKPSGADWEDIYLTMEEQESDGWELASSFGGETK